MIATVASGLGWAESVKEHSGFRWAEFRKGPDTIIVRMTMFSDRARGANSLLDAAVYYNGNSVEVLCGSSLAQQIVEYLDETGYSG